MAIFGDKKESKKGGKSTTAPRIRHARAAKLAAGKAHEVVRAPWFSEKAFIGTEKGVYVFAVPPRATKAEIAGAIKEIYQVFPRAVRITALPAKRKALRTRRGSGVQSARRKAYVYLNPGDTIQLG